MSATVTTLRTPQRTPAGDEYLDRYARQGRCISDRFVACKLGGMLMLKLTGFIQDEQAQILSVSESHVTLQMGQPWYRRWTNRLERRRPVEVRIQFAEPGADLAIWKQANARRSLVEVRIKPMTPLFSTRDFQRRADSILHLLRLHFMAD